jgi:hypothetical protein
MQIATGQVSVTSSGTTLIAAERAGRGRITVIQHGTTPVYVGLTGVTTTTGALLAGVAGATLTFDTEAAIYGASGGTQTVSFVEEF